MTFFATYGSVNLIYLGNFASTDPHEYNYTSENTSFLKSVAVDHTQMQLVEASFKDANSNGSIDDNDCGTHDTLTYDLGGGSVTNQTDGSLKANVTLQLADGSIKTVDVVMMQQENGDLFISDLQNNGSLDNLQISGVTINDITETDYLGWYSYQSVDGSTIIAPAPQADGIVEGTNAGETIDMAYTGDPDGDMIDAGDAVLSGQSGDQDIVEALGGNDSIKAGADNDVIYAGSGADTVLGEGGNDTLYGDSNLGGADPVEMARESFEWNKIADTNGGSGSVDDGDPLDGGVTQNTGNVDVTFSVVEATSHARTEFADNQQKVHSITDDGDSVDPYSSMSSELDGDYASATYAFDFSSEVENVSFRINDIDGDAVVKVYAYDAQGNPVDLDIHAGHHLHASDQDGVGGTEVLDSLGGYESDTSPNYSGLINIAGPVARIVVKHQEDGPNNSGINITDIYFDAPMGGLDSGVAGDDSLMGGEGDDVLYGEGGDDTLEGGAGNDVIYTGDGTDLANGGGGQDTIIGGGDNDVLRGGDDADTFLIQPSESGHNNTTVYGDHGGDDNDTLDLSALAADGFAITSITRNPENNGNPGFDGQVELVNAATGETANINYFDIENIIPCFTPGTAIATPKGERPIEELRIGDRIITRDNGIQEIRWLGRRDLQGRDLLKAPHLRPVLIRAGSLGHGLPESDMVVSPNHRVLINNDATALYFEEREVLAAAKHLTGLDGVDTVEASSISYIHFMFDQHEVVLSNGAWTESFQPGEQTIHGLGLPQREEIFDLFPELRQAEGLCAYQAARRSLKKHEAKLLVR